MSHALTILLHRPFVRDGRFAPAVESVSKAALEICNKAALEIDALLHLYKSKFCMKSPPYLITYATYASATIHVLVASQQQVREKRGAASSEPLMNCLEILSEQSPRNRATSQLRDILLALAKRMKVETGGRLTGDGYRERHRETQGNVLSDFSLLPASLGSSDFMGDAAIPSSAYDAPSLIMRTQTEIDRNDQDLDEWPMVPELLFDAHLLFGFQAPNFNGGDDFSGF